MDLDEIWQARYMPARRMQAANEPAYHAVKLDVCLTTNEIVAPFRQLTATIEPTLVRPEEEVRNRKAILSSSLTFLFFYDVYLIMCRVRRISTDYDSYRLLRLLGAGYGTIFDG